MNETIVQDYTGPDLCKLQAHEVVDLLKRREISPKDLLDASRQRHSETDPAINAMPVVCFERAGRRADIFRRAPSKDVARCTGCPSGSRI
jgi:amidase